MGRTNFEKLISKLKKFGLEAAKHYGEEQVAQLEYEETSVEISFLTVYNGDSKKEIEEEVNEFFREKSIPFTDYYDIEYYQSHVKGQYYVIISCAILVAANKKDAKKEMRTRCHKIVESQDGILGFKVE